MPASSVVTTEDMMGKEIPDTHLLGHLPTDWASHLKTSCTFPRSMELSRLSRDLIANSNQSSHLKSSNFRAACSEAMKDHVTYIFVCIEPFLSLNFGFDPLTHIKFIVITCVKWAEELRSSFFFICVYLFLTLYFELSFAIHLKCCGFHMHKGCLLRCSWYILLISSHIHAPIAQYLIT